MGFADDLDAILKETPPARQTTLFSATLPSRILKIAERHLTKPERVTVSREKTAAGKLPRVRQVAYIVRHGEKAAALDRILDMESPASAIVFCRTRLEVDTLVEALNAHGYRAEALHGGMQQRQRDAVMNRVRSAKTDLLIATDVAARGLDIQHVSHVINYDLPADAESYVHRIGRTGRAGREGTAITLAEPREHRLLRSIEQVTKQKIDVATVPTVSDLRARRLELTSAALRQQLTAGDFDDVRVVVESLSDEFDVVDIAAAAVKMAHLATVGDGDEKEIEMVRPAGEARSRHDGGVGTARLFVGAGRTSGIRPADLVGAIAGEAGVPSSAIGAIRISDTFSVVEVPEDLADDIISSMRGATLRGKKAVVRRDRVTDSRR
jgi:ATP-dependent RNA helicase DeaD